jgi:putative colanic acid biosynthesis acetyltransferase WcaF
MSPQVFFGWRRFLLRLFGAKIGKDVNIRPTVRITYPWKLEIGDRVWIGDFAELYNLGKISIGSNVAISHRVYLCAGTHDYQKKDFPILGPPICIEDEVWLPNDVFVGPGVTIGRGTVVGARSTVLNDLPSGMICYGNPAKPVRRRDMTD